MVKPSNFASGTTSISLSLIRMGSESVFVVEKQIRSSLHLDHFNCMPLIVDFKANLLTYSCIALVQCLSITSHRVESSTYFQRFTSPKTSRSFILTKDSQGPSLVPCGTPAGTVFHSEKQSSLNLTLCLRSVMKSNIQSIEWY
jgi:hypothetical protein